MQEVILMSALVSIEKRIHPFRSDDGDYSSLLEFMKEMAVLFSDEYDQDFPETSRTHDMEPYVHDIYRIVFEKDGFGFNVFHKMGYEPKYSGHAEDTVMVSLLGLENDMLFEIENTRYYHNPRYLELRVNAPESIAGKIQNAFLGHFEKIDTMTPEEIKTALLSAKAGVVRRAWSGAEKYARMILKADPNNSEALFYLGLCLAAQGHTESGEGYLQKAIDSDPENYDAYYNLALIYINRKAYADAIDLLVRGLALSKDNHPILYQLARVYELSGDIQNAIKYYERAIETSPNPGGHFHYTGLDFTEQAETALKKIR